MYHEPRFVVFAKQSFSNRTLSLLLFLFSHVPTWWEGSSSWFPWNCFYGFYVIVPFRDDWRLNKAELWGVGYICGFLWFEDLLCLGTWNHEIKWLFCFDFLFDKVIWIEDHFCQPCYLLLSLQLQLHTRFITIFLQSKTW